MKKKILFKAPVLTRSGYGEQSRFALRSLRSREDIFDIYIQPLQWGATSWINTMDEERLWIDQVIEKTIAFIQQGGKFDMSFQVTIPNEWEKIAPINIGYTAGIETTKVAHQWIDRGNIMDKIIVVSNHSKNTFKDTVYQAVNEETKEQIEFQLKTEIDVVNYPAKQYNNLPEIELELKHDINFVSIAQLGPRKNLPNTVKWFVEEFKDDEIGLILKTNLAKNCHMDRLNVFNQLTGMLSNYKDRKCSVYLLHGDMEDDEVHSIYNHDKVKALVSLAHGEGFGLPIFEATYSGMPVICNGWSGQCDFIYDEEGTAGFYSVSYDMNQVQPEVVWDGVLIKESMWAYSREHSAKKQMRECYNDIKDQKEGSIALNSKSFGVYTQERFSKDKQYEKMVNALLPFLDSEEDKKWRDVLDQVVEYE